MVSNTKRICFDSSATQLDQASLELFRQALESDEELDDSEVLTHKPAASNATSSVKQSAYSIATITNPTNEPVRELVFDKMFQSGMLDSFFGQLSSLLDIKLEIPVDSTGKTLQTAISENVEGHIFFETLHELACVFDANPEGKDVDYKRGLHEDIINFVRETLAHGKAFPLLDNGAFTQASKVLDEICHWMYREADLRPVLESFFLEQARLAGFTHLKEDLELVKTPKQFTDFIKTFDAALRKNPNYGTKPRQTRVESDPHLDGYILTRLMDALSTRFILTPRVTIEDSLVIDTNGVLVSGTIKICPEFKAHLRHLKTENEARQLLGLPPFVHLYVNNMVMNSEVPYEKLLTEEIVAMAQSDEFKDVLVVITIDRYSHFFYQLAPFDSSFGNAFSTSFKEQLKRTDKDASFYIPVELLPLDARDGIVDRVMMKLFPGKDTLNPVERNAAIDATLLDIIKTVCEKVKPYSTNVSCLATMDRGPTMLALIYVLDVIESDRPFTTQDMLNILSILYTPAILSSNRPPHDDRVERFADSLFHICEAYNAKFNEKENPLEKSPGSPSRSPKRSAQTLKDAAQNYGLQIDELSEGI